MRIFLIVVFLIAIATVCVAEDIHPNLLNELQYAEPYFTQTRIEINNNYVHLLLGKYASPFSRGAKECKYVKYSLPDFEIVNTYSEYYPNRSEQKALIPTQDNNAYLIITHDVEKYPKDDYGSPRGDYLTYVCKEYTKEELLLWGAFDWYTTIDSNKLLSCRNDIELYDPALKKTKLGDSNRFDRLNSSLPFEYHITVDPPLILHEDSLLIGAAIIYTRPEGDRKILRSKRFRQKVGVFIYNIETDKLIASKEFDLFDDSFVQSASCLYSDIDMYITKNNEITIIAGRCDGEVDQYLCWFSIDLDLNPIFTKMKSITNSTDGISYIDPGIEHQILRFVPNIKRNIDFLEIDEVGWLYRLVFMKDAFYYSKSDPIQARGRQKCRSQKVGY